MHTSQIRPLFADVKSIAEMTGIPVQSIRAMTREGILPARKRGNKWIYKIQEVIESLDSLPGKKSLDKTPGSDSNQETERVPAN